MPVRFTDVTESFFNFPAVQCTDIEVDYKQWIYTTFSPDGQHVVTAFPQQTPAFVVHKRTGELTFSRQSDITAPQDTYRKPVFSGNSQFFVVGLGRSAWPNVLMFERNGDSYSNMNVTMDDGGDNIGGNPAGLALSSDGVYMAQFYWWASIPSVRLFKRSGSVFTLIGSGQIALSGNSEVRTARFTPDDEYVFFHTMGNWDSLGHSGTVVYKVSTNSWSRQTDQQLSFGEGPNYNCGDYTAMSPDGTLIAIACSGLIMYNNVYGDRKVCIFSRNGNTLTFESETILTHLEWDEVNSKETGWGTAIPLSLCFTEDNEYLLVGVWGTHASSGQEGNLVVLKKNAVSGAYDIHESYYSKGDTRWQYRHMDIIRENSSLLLPGNDFVAFNFTSPYVTECYRAGAILTTKNPLLGITNLQAVEEEITHNEALIEWTGEEAAEEYLLQYREILPEE